MRSQHQIMMSRVDGACRERKRIRARHNRRRIARTVSCARGTWLHAVRARTGGGLYNSVSFFRSPFYPPADANSPGSPSSDRDSLDERILSCTLLARIETPFLGAPRRSIISQRLTAPDQRQELAADTHTLPHSVNARESITSRALLP